MLFVKKIAVVSFLMVLSLKPFAQVNLQTGSAVFSLPIFNWQDDKSRLTSVVALNYNSGNGLKVNDVASNVGQGWNLVAGGVITRIQVGEPDDQQADSAYPTLGDQDVTKYPNGYLYRHANIAAGCPGALTKYPTYGGQNIVYSQHTPVSEDKQVDYFSFQFNGKSGMFILDTAGGDHGVSLGDTKMKITFQRDPTTLHAAGIRTSIASFTITDVDGLIYKFTQYGYAKLLKSIYCSPDGSQHAQTQPTIKSNRAYFQSGFDLGPTASPWYNSQMKNPFVINSWYLTEIDDPFISGRKITFNYNTLNLNNSMGADVSYTTSSENYVVVSYKKSITRSLEIASIVYPDGHQVVFNYAAATRYDFAGEKAIASIDVMYSGRYLSEYQLNSTYFVLSRYGNPTNTSELRAARLCLKSVKKIGPDLKEDSPPYTFEYYLSTGSNDDDDIVPPSFCYSKDIWGFYNGKNSLQSTSPLTSPTTPVLINKLYTELDFSSLKGLCFQNDHYTGTGVYLNAKPNYAENGLLKEIIYPTGGSLTYTYAQNTGTFINGSGVNNVGGVHVSQTSSADGGYSNGCANPIVTHYDDVVNGAGSASSLWGLEAPKNSITTYNDYKDERQTIHWSFPANFTCKWHYLYPGILSQDQASSMTWWQQTMATLAPYLAVVSLAMDVIDVIQVIGSANSWNVIGVILDVISSVIGLIFTCSQTIKNTANVIYYDFDLNAGAPLPVQFKQVEITESSGAIGKTVQRFTHGDPNAPTDPDYYALWGAADNNTTFSPKQRFAPWAYGLPTLTTVYNASGNKIKETQNVYDFTNAKEVIKDSVPCGISHGAIASCKCQVITSYSQRSDNWSNFNVYNDPASYIATSNADMGVDIYNTYSGRALLNTTTERVYRTTDVTQFVQTTTNYWYVAPGCTGGISNNYEVRGMGITQSNGDYVFKTINYPLDFNEGVLQTLVQKNILSIPVATQTYITKFGISAEAGLEEKVTEFTQLSNGDVKPYRTLEQRFASPATSVFTTYSGPIGTNYSVYKIPQLYTYDANGNLTGLKDEGARTISNIYGYNDKFITASVINADPVLDKPAYSSFEETDLSRSGWTLSGTSGYYAGTSSATGTNYYILHASNATSLTSGTLNTSKPYILSFWAVNGNVSVSTGVTLSKTGPTYNGFTYYEYNVAQGTPSVTVKNSTASDINIDELRLYPANARMRTTTYDPVLGKTSECDENNRIVYYSYDNLGRLSLIKDESGNVVKMYEYNNVSAAKQTGCPASYGNHLISTFFTRNNCAAGYQGTNVSYTLAAGTYTSTKSQIDADMQAEINILTNGQNYANANGSCQLIYYNVAESETDSTQGCADGNVGGPVTYTVPAGTYSSIISQADANQQALDDVAANARAYINSPAHAVCVVDHTADWEYDPNIAPQCQVQGSPAQNSGNQLVQPKDVNPNSPTYNQVQTVNAGLNTTACPVGIYVNPATKWTMTTQSNTASGTTVSMNVTCYQEGTFTFTSPTKIGSLGNGGYSTPPPSAYIPTATRSATVTESGRTWAVTVDSSGVVYIKLTSGTKPPSGTSGSSIIYLVFSYTL